MNYLDVTSNVKSFQSCCNPFCLSKRTMALEKTQERECQKLAASVGQVNVLVKIFSQKLEEERQVMDHVARLRSKPISLRRKSFYHLTIADDIFSPSLQAKITASTLPIPPDNFLCQTDLKVFRNKYTGMLPNNGIRESDFYEISNLLIELKKNKSVGSLTIGAPASSPSVNQRKMVRGEENIFQMIVQLCRRKIGRQIIMSLVRQDRELRIIPSDDLDPCSITDRYYFSDKVKSVEIYINPDLIIEPEVIKNGKRYHEAAPLFIILGHEMLHALNHFQDQKGTTERRETKHSESKNMEEYFVMTGWETENAIPQWQQDKDDDYTWNWKENSLDDEQPCWSSFSENSLRSVYGLPPRTNSYSNKKITTVNARVNAIKKPFFDEIKKNYYVDVKNYFTKEFMQIICLKYDWKDFLNKALEEACKYRRWETVIQLVDWGADLAQVNINWKEGADAEVYFAFAEENDVLVDCLIKLGATPPNQNWQRGLFLSHKLKELFFYELTNNYFPCDFKRRFTDNFMYEIKRGMPWGDFLNEAAEIAAKNKSWEIVQLLIQEGATTKDFKHRWGEILDSEIVACCQKEDWERVIALIKLDANPNQKIGNSENLITFACEHYHPAICHLLEYLIKECRVNPDHCLYSALNTEVPSIELISFLIRSCKANPNCLIKQINPLWLAIKRRHFELIQPLIELGADPYTRSTGYQRFSLLHVLATKQDTPMELFEFLVNVCKMNPLAVSERGITPLSLAEGVNKEKLTELYQTQATKA